MTFDNTISDENLVRLFQSVRTIALVGASDKPHRASHGVMRFLQGHGYRVIPVNPMLSGKELLGETVYPDLASVPVSFDMVDVFRRSEEVAALVDESISLLVDKKIKAFWTQLNVWDEEAAARAEASGLQVVMDKCPAMEIPRLERAGLLP